MQGFSANSNPFFSFFSCIYHFFVVPLQRIFEKQKNICLMKKTRNLVRLFALTMTLWTTNANALQHLCNRWNVLMDSGFELGPVYGEVWTDRYILQSDTTINNVKYSCLWFADGRQNQQNWTYNGAVRETSNAEIYFIPANQSNEYLLFAFNAQVGDSIDIRYIMNKRYNVWAIVKENTEKEIIMDLYEQWAENQYIRNDYVWVKGIGAKRSMFQPLPAGNVGCVINFLLCAYNNETLIYTSDTGEEYGCEYRENRCQ